MKQLILKLTFLLCALSVFTVPAKASVVAHPTEVNADSPNSYYRFTEPSGAAVNDSSVNNNDGILRGAFTRNIAELLFNTASVDKAIDVSGATLTGATNSFTAMTGASFEAILKFDTVSDNTIIFQAGDEGRGSAQGFHRLYYRASENALRWNYKNVSGNELHYATCGFTPKLGQIYHLVITHAYAGTNNFKCYVDGALIAGETAKFALPLFNATPSFLNSFDGVADEIALYKSVLPPARVRAHFASARQADAAANVYYASPTGSIYARGTSDDGLDLQTALNFSLLQPGGILNVKFGTYTGIFSTRLSGAGGNQIQIRGIGLPTIDGAGLPGNVFEIRGSYLDVSGLRVRKTWLVRGNDEIGSTAATIRGSVPGRIVGGAGIALSAGTGNRVFHNVVHDVVGDGIGMSANSTDAVVAENLVFNNGWSAPRDSNDLTTNPVTRAPNGHGIYAQSIAPSTMTLSGNTFFSNYSIAIKIAGSGDSSVDNFRVTSNLVINAVDGVRIGGTQVNDLVYSHNKHWNSHLDAGFGTSNNTSAIFENNYLEGVRSFIINDFVFATVRDNEVIPARAKNSVPIEFYATAGYANWRTNGREVNHNTYWDTNPFGNAHCLVRAASGGVPIGITFNAYKSATGFDANSTYHESINDKTPRLPTTNKVFIEPQRAFAPNRGRVIVYNWAGATTQTVNLSTVLEDGTAYEIRSLTNYFAGAVVTGTFSTAQPNVALPLTIAGGLPAQAAPYGDTARKSEPAPNFAAFLVIPKTGVAK